MWVDIGVNFTAKAFADDRDAVMARAVAAGVSCQIFTGTSLTDSAEAQRLALQFNQYCTAGVHPHHASEWRHDSAQQLRVLAQQPRVCAIGECGLDFNRNFSPVAAQEQAFSDQLALAAELQLPVFLHCRDAHARFLALLTPWLPKLPAAVLHCFTGQRDELADCLALGLHIGITGWICDERRGQALLEMLTDIPLDRLLLETDAPWLLPRDLRPKPKSGRNEPALLPHIAATVANRLSLSLPTLAALTRANAARVFGLAAGINDGAAPELNNR